MKLPLIKKIFKICCTVTILTITPACQQKCPQCECSEVSTVVQAKPERRTRRHHKTSFVNEKEDDEDLEIDSRS